MKKLLLCAALVGAVLVSHAQYLTGTPVKDYTIRNIINHPEKTKKISDFRGKLLVLDFWSSSCASCIASFPKMDRLAKKYKKDIEFIMVGVAFTTKSRMACEEIFTRHQKKYALSLPAAFDTTMFRDFDLSGVPHAIVIGRDGTILASIGTYELSDSVFDRLAANQPIDLPESLPGTAMAAKSDSTYKGLYNVGNDLSLIRYSSILTNFKPGYPPANANFRVRENNYGIRALNFPGIYIYTRLWPTKKNMNFPLNRIIYEMKNPARLTDSLYCFEVIVPDELVADRMKIARQDFDRGLGIVAHIEKRKIPCLVLIADDTARLSTKGGKVQRTEKDKGVSGFTYTNCPMDDLMATITSQLNKELPIVDETGIQGHIDIDVDFDTSISRLERYRKAIAPFGLRLIGAEREMEVLVINDATK